MNQLERSSSQSQSGAGVYRVRSNRSGEFQVIAPNGGHVYTFCSNGARDPRFAAEDYAAWHNGPSVEENQQ